MLTRAGSPSDHRPGVERRTTLLGRLLTWLRDDAPPDADRVSDDIVNALIPEVRPRCVTDAKVEFGAASGHCGELSIRAGNGACETSRCVREII